MDAAAMGPREARALAPLAARVLAQFYSAENTAYLRGVLAPWGRGDEDAVLAFGARAREVLADDPTAQRGGAARFWAEVRRLNGAFVAARRRARATGTGGAEPYHMRAFVADSLRPPGLEHLNGPGPLYAIREDRVGEGRPAAGSAARFAPGSSAARRYMRYETIPFWQKSGERNYERDIEETLGLGSRELAGMPIALRGWPATRR